MGSWAQGLLGGPVPLPLGGCDQDSMPHWAWAGGAGSAALGVKAG